MKEEFRVLICGGRDYNDVLRMENVLTGEILAHSDKEGKELILISGGARGADRLAEEWAWDHEVTCITVPAKWRQFNNAAGPIRNTEMLQRWRPNLVVAFPGMRGTRHMVSIAQENGIAVREVQ